MSNWKSMDTAPRDGKHILLKFEEGIIQGYYQQNEENWKYINEKPDHERWMVIGLTSHGCGCCSGENDAPVAWMEIPE